MVGQIIQRIKKYRQDSHINAVKGYLSMGNSHLLNSFKLILNFPMESKKYLTVGTDTILDCVVTFESQEGEVHIGDRSYVGNSQLISRSRIEIQNDVFIAWGCYLYDHDSHSLDYKERENDIMQQLKDYRAGISFIENKNWTVVNSKPIKICSNAWIGMNSIILKGVTVGEGAIVAAGSVVTKDVPAWCVVAGNPARVVKEIPEDLRRK